MKFTNQQPRFIRPSFSPRLQFSSFSLSIAFSSPAASVFGSNYPRWNATEMWEKLRGKRLMFVGDSLNRGQWIVCLLQSVIPENKRSMTPNAQLTVFQAEEYNATVEFLWAPLLVESNSDDPVNHRLDEWIIRPDSVLKYASKWEHASKIRGGFI